jgi:hypothetical protein
MQKQLLLSLLVFLPCLLFAQRQYWAATITKNDGTVVSGKIAVKNWLKPPKRIVFQPNEGKKQRYGVSDLSAYHLTRPDGNTMYFERKFTSLEISPNNLNELDYEAKLKYQKDTAWFQVIYKGEWKLLSYSDYIKKHWLLEIDSQPPLALVLKPWRMQNLNSNTIQRVDMFRRQLSVLGASCPRVQAIARSKRFNDNNDLELNSHSLITICAAFDSCSGKSATYIAKPDRGDFFTDILIGWHSSTFSNIVPSIYLDAPQVSGFQAGLGFGYYFFRSNKWLALHNDVIIYKGDFEKSQVVGNQIPYRTDLQFEATQVVFSNTLAIRIANIAINPMLRIGIANRFHLNQKILVKEGPVLFFPDIDLVDKSSTRGKHEIGPIIGIAGSFGHINIAMSYYVTNNSKNSVKGNEADTGAFGVNIGYRLL